MATTQDKPLPRLRLATADDIPTIIEIGRNASQRSHAQAPELADVVDRFALTADEAQQRLEKGRIYLAENSEGQPLGFTSVYEMDTVLYISGISVNVNAQGQGTGGLLLNAILDWARERARDDPTWKAKVSLATYREVPWNAPWYRKYAFKEVDPDTIGPNHAEKMRLDRERGVETGGYTRCIMLWEE